MKFCPKYTIHHYRVSLWKSTLFSPDFWHTFDYLSLFFWQWVFKRMMTWHQISLFLGIMPKGILDMIMMLDAKKIIYTALRNHNAALEYNMHMIGICFTTDFFRAENDISTSVWLVFRSIFFFSCGILDMK